MVIAIDYDGTITDNTPYPHEGKIREDVIFYIKNLYEKGHTLILWTARKDVDYLNCLIRLNEARLLEYFTFDERLRVPGKIEADFYIDDRSVIGELDWKAIYHYLINKEEK